MRAKETADDYRLFPDPDLTPFDLSDDFVEEARSRIPELPDAKRDRYIGELGLKRADARQIAADPRTSALFEEAVAGVAGEDAEKIVSTIAKVMVNLLPGHEAVSPDQIRCLSGLLATDAVTFAQAREVLDVIDGTDAEVERLVDERGMRQASDVSVLAPVVDEVLGRCADQARQYREGNEKVIGFLVGQCMRASRGGGNPKLFKRILSERLET